MSGDRGQYFDGYFDSIFSLGADLTSAGFKRACEEYAAQYRELLPVSKDAAILDAGSGAGHFLYFLEKNGYLNVTGIDISPQQVDFCRKNISEKAVLADIFEYLRDKSSLFDLISLNDILEHISKDKVLLLLSLCRRGLKPGGRLVIKTPNMGNFFSLYARYKDFTHESGFTERSLRQVLLLSGFKEMTIFGFDMPLPATAKGRLQKIFVDVLRALLVRLFWYQGYVPPAVMTPLLMAAAIKDPAFDKGENAH